MKTNNLLFSILFCLAAPGCNKQNEWLDIKPNKADVTPATIDNYQALLDQSDGVLNSNTPGIGMVGMDNYYVTSATYNAVSTPAERNGYIWAADTWEGGSASSWNDTYAGIAITNITLDGLARISRTNVNSAAWDNVQGSAYFFRAFSYYNLSQLFMKQFDASTAGTDPGLPLRVSSDINAIVPRATVAATYDLMVSDLALAETLLPDKPVYQTRPSKQAVYALEAKLYLHKGDYAMAASYANKSLQVSEKLVDFNTLSAAASKPMPVFPTHPEIIFYTMATIHSIVNPSSNKGIVDTILFQSYAANDLRKTMFFIPPNALGQVFFKGQYTASVYPFSGLANNETLLVLAESQARLQQIPEALATLNKLLIRML